ncbi:hypothetical protein D3C71_2031220 [compost metagenome]
MTCMMVTIPGITPESTRFSRAEAASRRPKASVAPNTYFIAFFAPDCCTADRITILVGPGVNVTMTQ